MNFIESIKQRAKNDIKTIVLPEAEDIRTLKAAEIALKENYANIVLVGNKDTITKLAISCQYKMFHKLCTEINNVLIVCLS